MACTSLRRVASLLTDRRSVWYLALSVVALIAFALRSYDLANNPPEFFEDELSGVASAWSIVTTGHDMEKTWLPFLVTRLEMKQPVYFFTALISQTIFGQEVWAARLPAVIFGVLSSLLLVWLMRLLQRSRMESLMAGGIFAVVPWAVHYGRIGWEPAALIPFTVLGLYLLWNGVEKHKRGLVIASAAILALGAYTYHPALLMNVLLAATVVAIHFRSLKKQDWIALALGSGFALLILGPYMRAFLAEPLFTWRTANISVFAHGLNAESLGLTWHNYWEQWNPEWLFFSGNDNLRNEPGVALTFPWVWPFFALGIFELARRHRRADLFLLTWLVLGPLPAGLTDDGVPHFTRGLLALPPLVMITATGIELGWRITRKGRMIPLVFALAIPIAIVIQEGIPSYRYYFTAYPTLSAEVWQYGSRESLKLTEKYVPVGGILCIEDGTISPFTFPHYLAYYLGNRKFQVVEGNWESDERCGRVGTYVLLRPGKRSSGLDEKSVASVKDKEGFTSFELLRVLPSK